MMQRIDGYILGKLSQKEIDQLWIVGVDQMAVIPRIGETVYLPSLVRDKFCYSYFDVKQIIHHIEKGLHTIEIHMDG